MFRARGCSKHVDDSNKHIMQEIVRQVGYLPEETFTRRKLCSDFDVYLAHG
jgi:hypothetical protein